MPLAQLLAADPVRLGFELNFALDLHHDSDDLVVPEVRSSSFHVSCRWLNIIVPVLDCIGQERKELKSMLQRYGVSTRAGKSNRAVYVIQADETHTVVISAIVTPISAEVISDGLSEAFWYCDFVCRFPKLNEPATEKVELLKCM